MANTPPSLLITSFQRNTIPAPPTIPAIAPVLLVRFQNREKSISGPNVAPKPAHANDTIWKITLFSSRAIIIPINVNAKSVTREIIITCLSVAFFLKIP